MAGQSFPDFATVLKQTETENDDEHHMRKPHVNIASAIFSAGFNPAAKENFSAGKTSAIFDVQDSEIEDERLQREMLELARRMENQSPASIRVELGLRNGMKRVELQRLRRSFAANNHPDLLPLEFRVAAEQRMKTANALLDSAMASAPKEF